MFVEHVPAAGVVADDGAQGQVGQVGVAAHQGHADAEERERETRTSPVGSSHQIKSGAQRFLVVMKLLKGEILTKRMTILID